MCPWAHRFHLLHLSVHHCVHNSTFLRKRLLRPSENRALCVNELLLLFRLLALLLQLFLFIEMFCVCVYQYNLIEWNVIYFVLSDSSSDNVYLSRAGWLSSVMLHIDSVKLCFSHEYFCHSCCVNGKLPSSPPVKVWEGIFRDVGNHKLGKNYTTTWTQNT